MKIKKGKSSAIPMPKLKKSEPRKLPYQQKKLPDHLKKLPDNLRNKLGKPMPDLDKIIKKQESGGYSKTYRNK